MRQRIDQYLVDTGLSPSREKAKRAIIAGTVKINGHRAKKPSDWVRPADEVSVDEPEKYVSRGGLKLEHALDSFQLEVANKQAVDLGASTGGFTDCLLQRGAREVFAIDVGQGQLAWKLRQDPRVIVMENTNARYLERHHLPKPFEGADLIVIDCSFISLKKILPTAVVLTGPQSQIIALIKPQFEAGKQAVDRGRGVIKDPAIHAQVLADLKTFVEDTLDLRWRSDTESPILGPAGNKEFLCLIETKDAPHKTHRSRRESRETSLESESPESG